MASKPATEKTLCPVCQEEPRQARLLPCGHQLCTHCLQEHVTKSGTGNAFQCPTCRQECQLPSGMVEEIPMVGPEPASPPNDAVEEGTSSSAALPTAICVNSKHGAATAFCNDCAEFYCDSCASHHGLFGAMRGHRFTSVDEMSDAALQQAKSACKSTCIDHEEEKVTIFCKTCKIPICHTCARFKHKEHKHQELVESARDARKELQKMIEATTQHITKQDDIIEEMQKVEIDIHGDVTTAKTTIKEAAQRIRDVVTKREETMLRDLDVHEAEAVTKVSSVQKEASTNKACASSFKQDIQTLYHSARDIDQVKRTPGRLDEFSKLTETQQQSVTWKFNAQDKQPTEDSIMMLLGNVSLESSPEITLEGPLHTIPLVYKGNKAVSGMVVVGGNIFITHFGESKLWMYDVTTGYKKDCDIPGLGDARCMAVVNAVDHTLVITDHKRKVHFVKISPDLEIVDHKVKESPIPSPHKVSVCAMTEQLLIGSWCGRKFAKCNSSGELLHKIEVPESGEESDDALCAEKNKDGYAVLVYHGKKHGIQWLDEKGNVSHTFGYKEGQQLGGSAFRCHMFQTGDAQLIVADNNNHRLPLVDHRGHLTKYLLTEEDGIKYPSCVYLDEEGGRLYLAHRGSGSREVRVYKWPVLPPDPKVTNFRLKYPV